MSFTIYGPPVKFSDEDIEKQRRFYELNPGSAPKTAVPPQAIGLNPEPTKPEQTQNTGQNLDNPNLNPSKQKKGNQGHQSVPPRKFSQKSKVCSCSFKTKHTK